MCSPVTRNFTRVIKFFYRTSSPYTCRVLEPINIGKKCEYSTNSSRKTIVDEENNDPATKNEPNLSGTLGQEFQEFRDEDASIIFDVDEEQKRIDYETINALQVETDRFEGLNFNRGVDGVYEIKDLVELLRRDKAENIFVARVPKEYSYVDYMVIVNGRSTRHMTALAQFVRLIYKKKACSKDILPKIEGAKSTDWIALDLGNIALHIFSKPARKIYDLETLWSVGPKYDPECNKPDESELFQAQYRQFLMGVEPADAPEK